MKNSTKGTRSRLADALFTGYLHELLTNITAEASHGVTPGELLSEVLHYLEMGGKFIRLRMPSGRLHVQRAFDPVNPGTEYPVVETQDSKHDENLPIYSNTDFSYLDGVVRDLRERADQLGLPWSIAVGICKGVNDLNESSDAELMERVEADRMKASLNTPVITVDECSKLLKLSRSTVYRLLEEGKLKRPSLGRQGAKRGKALVLTESVRDLLAESSE